MQRYLYILLIVFSFNRVYGQTSQVCVRDNNDIQGHTPAILLYIQTEGIPSYLIEEGNDFYLAQSTQKLTSLLNIFFFPDSPRSNGYAYMLISDILLPNHLDLPPPIVEWFILYPKIA